MGDHHEQLIDLILGDKDANLNEVKPTSPLKEYWERGYQVIIAYHKSEMTKMEKYAQL